MKKCIICSNYLNTNQPKAKICKMSTCRQIYNKQRGQRWYDKNRRHDEILRRKNCVFCGIAFKAKNINKKFCSNKCRQLNFRSMNSNYNNQYQLKYKKDINNRMAATLRNRISNAIAGRVKSGSAIRDLGCSLNKLRLYMQLRFYRRFKDNEIMSWDNYGEWHIDHIKPLSKFDLSDPEEFKQACHYTNLQPLWKEDNWKKSNK